MASYILLDFIKNLNSQGGRLQSRSESSVQTLETGTQRRLRSVARPRELSVGPGAVCRPSADMCVWGHRHCFQGMDLRSLYTNSCHSATWGRKCTLAPWSWWGMLRAGASSRLKGDECQDYVANREWTVDLVTGKWQSTSSSLPPGPALPWGHRSEWQLGCLPSAESHRETAGESHGTESLAPLSPQKYHRTKAEVQHEGDRHAPGLLGEWRHAAGP